MVYFTSNVYLSTNDSRIKDRFIPMDLPTYFYTFLTNISKLSDKDDLYILGNFIDFDIEDKPDESTVKYLLSLIKYTKANVYLLIGEQEEHIIQYVFNSSYEKFRKYCLSVGFTSVCISKQITVRDTAFVLNHYPRKYANGGISLFGYISAVTGWYAPYGINMDYSLYHLQLVSEDMLFYLLTKKEEKLSLGVSACQ